MSHQVDCDFLREEYFHLQKSVDDYDQRTLTMKGWSVTASLAAVGAAFTQKAPSLLLMASTSALLFWVIEAIWKSFQQAYYPRIRAIEDFMHGAGSEKFSSPGISHSWSASWRRNSFVRIMWWGHVCLPHVAIFVAGILLWFLNLSYPIVPK
jgi:uncharacterized membrane protein